MTKWLTALTKVVIAASVLATLGWAFATLFARPLDGVEGDVLFEADRLKAGLRLYTNPVEVAFDYGPVPARYLVLYPPLWSALLSVTGASATVARVISTLSWFGLLGWIVYRAEQRRQAMWVAAFVAGVATLALFGASGRPDSFAVLASGLAVERATRHRRIDVLCGLLFAIAAFVKPNVVGAAPGLFLFAVIGKRPFVKGLLGLASGAAAIAGVLTLLAGKAWVTHLLLSTAQPPSAHQLFDQLLSRGPFFALPFLAAIVLGRKEPLAFGALLSSVAWCVMSLAKIGSASNYLMEPCICLVIVFARVRAPRRSTLVAAVILAQVLWVDVASLRSAAERTGEAFVRQEVLRRIRAGCTGIVVADEPGIERMLNGRIVQTPFQTTHLGPDFPVDLWMGDLARPEIGCLVMQDDLLERPMEVIDGDHDRFAPVMRRFFRRHFVLVKADAGLYWYNRAQHP